MKDYAPGDRVEVHGLQSEAGRTLNGSVGIVSCLDTSSGRYQVDIEGQNCRALKPENLRSAVTSDAPDMGASENGLIGKFVPGDRVEVHSLQSDTGQALNGMIGVVTCADGASGRYQVHLENNGPRALKPENLRPISKDSKPQDVAATEALATLATALDPANADVDRRFQALRSIRDVGCTAKALEPHVARCLEDASWRIRGAAVEALSSIGCTETHGKTLERLLCDSNGDVRFAVAEALGRGAAAAHVDALAQALSDEDDGVCMAAAVSLGKAGAAAAGKHAGSLATLLDAESVQLRLAGANSLGKLGSAVVPYLQRLVLLCENDSSKEVRLAAALTVAQAGEDADPYEERIAKVLEELG